ncbi:MAG: hypothetical protein IJG02_00520 [Thermoguttaceae bacterium]|nr:hypothetical protein [Thermoguttaceae bacterium]
MDFYFTYPTAYFPRYYLRQSFFARRGQLPMRSAVSFSDKGPTHGLLKISVDWDEIGTIHVPYLHKSYGLTFFSTASLRPAQEPLNLVRELARGQMARAAEVLYEWRLRGVTIPAKIEATKRQALGRLAALLVEDETAEGFDHQALALFDSLVSLNHYLIDEFVEQFLAARRYGVAPPAFLGFNARQTRLLNDYAESHPEYRHLFECWNPSLTWRDLEPTPGHYRWDKLDMAINEAQGQFWEMCLGPIVRWDRAWLPDWIVERLDDPYTVRKALFRYAEQLIARYPKTAYWVVSSDVGSELDSILVSKRIEWTDSLARQVRSVNPSAKALLMMERPWGDSLRFSSEVPPLEIGERLAPNRFIDGFLLDINIGLGHDASLPRDTFSLNTLLDKWSLLRKPFYVSLSIPSAPSNDIPDWKSEQTSEPPWTPKTQQEMVHRFMMALLSRRGFRGLFWNQLTDSGAARADDLLTGSEDTKRFAELAAGSQTTLPRTPKDASDQTTSVLGNSARGDHNQDGHATKISLRGEEQPLNSLYPLSGLMTGGGEPKPAFKKIAAIQRAYM